MQRLQTNAVRVYAVDPTQDHDDCMSTLADAGIYVVLDLGTPSNSINRDDPSWAGPLYQRYISVIDAFSKYNNVLGYFAGNEVSNSHNTTAASAYVKAAVRDSKSYIKQQNYRSVGVGYATYDGPIREQLAQYFVCADPGSSIDFWGYNVYSWCGDSDYKTSGYQERTDFFRDYPVPVFFAEYGCNQGDGGSRKFTEVGTLFGDLMTPVFSGGIVYMWFQEANDYGKMIEKTGFGRAVLTVHIGLVNINGNNVSPRPDFTALSSEMAKASPSSTAMNDYQPSAASSWSSCPAVVTTSSGPQGTDAIWMAQATPLPPTPNQALCQCEMETLSCISTSNDMRTYGDDFGYICGKNPNACAGIESNATSGKFGAISQCSPQQQLSWAMNKYYQAQSNDAKSSACDFDGRAKTTSASSAAGTCGTLVMAAGSNGQGTVPQPSGNSQSQSSNGASSSSSGASPRGVSIPSLDAGMLQLGLYAVGAMISGAGMILL